MKNVYKKKTQAKQKERKGSVLDFTLKSGYKQSTVTRTKELGRDQKHVEEKVVVK